MDKILFVGIRTDELGLDTGEEVEGLGLGLIEIAGPVKSPSRSLVLVIFLQNALFQKQVIIVCPDKGTN